MRREGGCQINVLKERGQKEKERNNKNFSKVILLDIRK